MMVAEQFGELVRLIAHRAEDLWPAVPQEPQVVPVVLYPLSPFVDVLGSGVLANVAEAVAATLVASLQAGSQVFPARFPRAPVLDRDPPGRDFAGCLSGEQPSPGVVAS